MAELYRQINFLLKINSTSSQGFQQRGIQIIHLFLQGTDQNLKLILRPLQRHDAVERGQSHGFDRQVGFAMLPNAGQQCFVAVAV